MGNHETPVSISNNLAVHSTMFISQIHVWNVTATPTCLVKFIKKKNKHFFLHKPRYFTYYLFLMVFNDTLSTAEGVQHQIGRVFLIKPILILDITELLLKSQSKTTTNLDKIIDPQLGIRTGNLKNIQINVASITTHRHVVNIPFTQSEHQLFPSSPLDPEKYTTTGLP